MPHDLLNSTLQYLASGAGAIGATLMAMRITQPRVAYFIWIGSNLLFIPYCALTDQWGVLGLNVVYLAINVIGLIRWREPRLLPKVKQ